MKSPLTLLQSLWVKNVDKFDMLVDLSRGKIDILLISETKIDNTFPTSQYGKQGYTLFRLNRSANEGDLLLYTRNTILAKKLPYLAFGNTECITFETTISYQGGGGRGGGIQTS